MRYVGAGGTSPWIKSSERGEARQLFLVGTDQIAHIIRPVAEIDLGSGSAVGFSRWSPRWSLQTVIGSTEFLPFYFMYRPYFVYRPDESHGPLVMARGGQCRAHP